MTKVKAILNRTIKDRNRSRRRTLVSIATLYSLWMVTVIPCTTAADRYMNTSQKLRGSVNELPRVQLQSFSRHRLAVNDLSSFNDDTTIEEIKELMEEGNEDNYLHPDDDTIPISTNSIDDDGLDEDLNDFLDVINEALGNVTNSTTDEIFEGVIDVIFGGPSSDNTTNATPSLVGVVDKVITGIFGSSNDDDVSPNGNAEKPESSEEISVKSQTPIQKTNEDVVTTNFKEMEIPPSPANMTDNNNMNDGKEHHNDIHDDPQSPRLNSHSPTVAPRSRPTLMPTESPTSERIDFDEKDKETEKGDDDEFDQKSSYNKRPVGNSSIPNNKFNIAVVLGTLAAIIGMIFTAWQMSDNPDGIYASFCRLTLTFIQLVFRIIMSPCRKFCGYRHHHMAATNGYHEPYGHLPVSTMDYGYKDPTLELT